MSEKAAKPNPTGAIAAYICGVLLLVFVLALAWGARSQSTNLTSMTTTGQHSPQYIGGDYSTFNVNPSVSSSEEIPDILAKNKLLPSKLSDSYPYGWALFNHTEAGTRFHFSNGELRANADWEETKLDLNTDSKTYALVLPELRWQRKKQTFNVIESIKRPYTGTYEVGKPTVIQTRVWVEGAPQIHLEVLDDNQRSPVYVIGFKKSYTPPPLSQE